MGVRVNKYLSEAGFCSRREADKYIEQGRVEINGLVVGMGAQVEMGDQVAVDGERLNNVKKRVYIAFNKPEGVTSTTDPGDPTNIVSYINYPERIFNIGRLDKPSEGLIFLTNDGNIVNKILRAGNSHEKEYVVTVDKPITSDFALKMSTGVRILGTLTQKCKFIKEGEFRFRIILTQGLNRQIRRMCEVLGYKVSTLKRMRIMNITLGGLGKGEWRYFTESEITELNRLIAESVGTEEASTKVFRSKSTYKTPYKKEFNPAAGKPEKKFGAKSEAKSGAKPESKFGAKSEAKFGAKAGGKFGAKSDGRTGSKPGGKFSPKSDGKFSPKSENKFGAGYENKFGAKSGGSTKSGGRLGPKPDSMYDSPPESTSRRDKPKLKTKIRTKN